MIAQFFVNLHKRVLIRDVVADVNCEDVFGSEPLLAQVWEQGVSQVRQRLTLIPRHAWPNLPNHLTVVLDQALLRGANLIHDGFDARPELFRNRAVVRRDAKHVVLDVRPRNVRTLFDQLLRHAIHHVARPLRGLMRQFLLNRLAIRRRLRPRDVQPVRPGVVQLVQLYELRHLLPRSTADDRRGKPFRALSHRFPHRIAHERLIRLRHDRRQRPVVV